MIIYDFQFRFESSIQWEIWEIELLGRLEIIFGANRIALSYVISQNSVPRQNDQFMLDEKQYHWRKTLETNTRWMH